jgi:hypothetical protein
MTSGVAINLERRRERCHDDHAANAELSRRVVGRAEPVGHLRARARNETRLLVYLLPRRNGGVGSPT